MIRCAKELFSEVKGIPSSIAKPCSGTFSGVGTV